MCLLKDSFRWERLVDRAEAMQLEPTMVGSKAASKACNMFNCFDVYRFEELNIDASMPLLQVRGGWKGRSESFHSSTNSLDQAIRR